MRNNMTNSIQQQSQIKHYQDQRLNNTEQSTSKTFASLYKSLEINLDDWPQAPPPPTSYLPQQLITPQMFYQQQQQQQQTSRYVSLNPQVTKHKKLSFILLLFIHVDSRK